MLNKNIEMKQKARHVDYTPDVMIEGLIKFLIVAN